MGENAFLVNDSVLYFTRRIGTVARKSNPKDFYTQKKSGKMNAHDYWSKDSTYILSNLQVLSAKSKSPLQIELPLLGYRVYLDLVSFDIISPVTIGKTVAIGLIIISCHTLPHRQLNK